LQVEEEVVVAARTAPAPVLVVEQVDRMELQEEVVVVLLVWVLASLD
jgi:hypothetical protein